VPHVIESASSGRAKCRGCDRTISKGELRFGERQPNAFGEGEMTLWFHLPCAAFKRPEPFLEVAASSDAPPEAAALVGAAQTGIEHRRLPRINGAERAATGRARCRRCKELIAKDAWRIALSFFEEYRFNPGGFIHATCAAEYFETADILDRVHCFSPALTSEELAELGAAVRSAAESR